MVAVFCPIAGHKPTKSTAPSTQNVEFIREPSETAEFRLSFVHVPLVDTHLGARGHQLIHNAFPNPQFVNRRNKVVQWNPRALRNQYSLRRVALHHLPHVNSVGSTLRHSRLERNKHS